MEQNKTGGFLIDCHSHILPGIDDGASDENQSAEMLKALYGQGIRYCLLTPHFFSSNEPLEKFLERRSASLERLMSVYDAECMPKVAVGAEVHISKNFSQSDLSKLTVNGTDILLIEFPFTEFKDWMIADIERVVYEHRLTPMIAHIDRVMATFSKHDLMDLFEFDEFIFQVNNESFSDFFVRRQLLSVLQNAPRCVLGSDSHDLSRRKPNFDIAKKYIANSKKTFELYECITKSSEELIERIFS